ncbi:hypothetical protein E2F46_10700 [Luteimonas aestuarii]|uniref:Uncharacterized protein n=1 Tax=Luteimonas aestuarii TaxID=453837 RepID=A0A4R5TRA2_9GAMM|nr:hypothetical protein [Luteimonas aestuarii]TDK23382.1 hypothetical protein E2F46_10700 [Luteimonas aestuarii]
MALRGKSGAQRALTPWLVGTLALALAASAGATSAELPRAPAGSGDETLDNAVAAVVVAALGEQFAGHEPISIRLDVVDVVSTSERDRVVSGEGRLRLGDDPDWIGFRYRTRYDGSFGNAGYPELVLGGVGDVERVVPNDAALVRQLDDQVVAELDRTQGGGARLQLDRIDTAEAGHRFLRIDASGIVDFGLRGLTPIRIESLYDTARSTWQRVYYELGLVGDASE